MPGRSLAIAHVGTVDEGGGAAGVTAGLTRAYAARGHRVWQVVGRPRTGDPRVVLLPDDDRLAFRLSGYTALQSALTRLAGRFPNRGFGRAGRTLRLATHPRAAMARLSGLEDFEFPGTARLVERLGARPDLVHGHNLHGGYFDLRALASISAAVPTVLTLHDMWMLTGHCAHSLDCDRWRTGCGQCPYLGLEPAVRGDRTAENWRRKRQVYAGSRLHVATPSRWLRDKVAASILAPAVQHLRVIPNGVDRQVFRPAPRAAVRAALGLPTDRFIVMLTTGSLGSMWKDDVTLRETMKRLSAQAATRDALFVAVGRDSAVTAAGAAHTLALPFQRDRHVMAQYYQSADLYLHAAHADTFPLAVLEAMACGTPVVATAVGGVPEQIHSIDLDAMSTGEVGDANGVLVGAGDAAQMARAVEKLWANPDARRALGENARADVEARFDLERQADAYLDWYQELLR
jgi:glycosyltransferase involved in cell wall biosynthesis